MAREKIDYGDDVYLLDDFIDMVETGMFIDDDGFGLYSNGKVVYTQHMVHPSNIANGDTDYTFTHVVWYNK